MFCKSRCCLDKVPLNVEDTSVQLAQLLEGSRAEVQGTVVALVAGALVDHTGNDRLGGVVAEADADTLVAGGVAPGLGTHHQGRESNNRLRVAVPLHVAGAVAIGEPGGLARVLVG